MVTPVGVNSTTFVRNIEFSVSSVQSMITRTTRICFSARSLIMLFNLSRLSESIRASDTTKQICSVSAVEDDDARRAASNTSCIDLKLAANRVLLAEKLNWERTAAPASSVNGFP